MRTVTAIMLALSMSACAGQRWYKDEAQFQAYVTSLNLSQLSPPDAQAKLVSLGYRCESQAAGAGETVVCTEVVSHPYGGQTHIVRLSPSKSGSGTQVLASLNSVVV
jgi:hypothetical protein